MSLSMPQGYSIEPMKVCVCFYSYLYLYLLVLFISVDLLVILL